MRQVQRSAKECKVQRLQNSPCESCEAACHGAMEPWSHGLTGASGLDGVMRSRKRKAPKITRSQPSFSITMSAPPRASGEPATPSPGADPLLPPSQPTEPTASTPQPPQQPPPRPYTSFRPYLRDIMKSRFPPPAGKDGDPALPNKWDEVCMQWCSQRRLSREDGEAPRCQMVCLRRKERGREGTEEVQEEAPRASKPVRGTWNLLDGYYLYVATRMEECQQHIEGTYDGVIEVFIFRLLLY